ncbi:hypothetical protein ON010_g13377 [Phytophthora cinnamomi]|nr:hypothetical protein ON010_g13377 [Phytophthora cinnamomi]
MLRFRFAAALRAHQGQAAHMSSMAAGSSGAPVCVLAILGQHKAFLRSLDDDVYTFHSPLVEAREICSKQLGESFGGNATRPLKVRNRYDQGKSLQRNVKVDCAESSSRDGNVTVGIGCRTFSWMRTEVEKRLDSAIVDWWFSGEGERVLQYIREATESICVGMFILTHKGATCTDEIIEKAKKGLKLRLVTDLAQA